MKIFLKTRNKGYSVESHYEVPDLTYEEMLKILQCMKDETYSLDKSCVNDIIIVDCKNTYVYAILSLYFEEHELV